MKNEEIAAKIKASGGRRTKVRQAVVAALSREGELVSASELLSRLERVGVPADRTTVYRELAFLKKSGIVREVGILGRPSLFEIEGEHHHHLVCLDCGTHRPVKIPPALCEQEKRLGKKEEFKITGHSLEFYGLCKKCQ